MAIPTYNKKVIAKANHCVPHMMQVLDAARKAELRVCHALHHRCRPGDYETWKYIEILGEQLERVAPNPNVVVLKNTGHWVLEENPKGTTDALINFL